MTETPEKVVFTDKDGTFRIGSFTDNSYYVTVTPTLGQTKAPISTVKTVYSVVDKGKPGTYFVADPTSLPKGLILKDLYDNKDYIGIAKNLIGLDDTFKMALSGYSTDAHKYINLFKSNPSVATRYNPVPMTSFNTAGTNTGLYSKLAVADIAENPYVKEAMLRRINDELLAMNADPAYLQHGIVQIPQPSYVMKHPVTPSVTPGELLTNTYVN